MSVHDEKKLYASLKQEEYSSARKVDSESSFIVRVSFFSKEKLSLKNIARSWMTLNPRFCFVQSNRIFLYFSPSSSHLFDGDHHLICSHFVSNATKATIDDDCRIECSIIEFQNHIVAHIYLCYASLDLLYSYIEDISSGKIKSTDLKKLTQKEIDSKLKTFKISLSAEQRNGIFILSSNKKLTEVSEKLEPTKSTEQIEKFFI